MTRTAVNTRTATAIGLAATGLVAAAIVGLAWQQRPTVPAVTSSQPLLVTAACTGLAVTASNVTSVTASDPGVRPVAAFNVTAANAPCVADVGSITANVTSSVTVSKTRPVRVTWYAGAVTSDRAVTSVTATQWGRITASFEGGRRLAFTRPGEAVTFIIGFDAAAVRAGDTARASFVNIAIPGLSVASGGVTSVMAVPVTAITASGVTAAMDVTALTSVTSITWSGSVQASTVTF